MVNGTEVTAMLDTGSPISRMPRKISKRLNFQNEREPPKGRRFVDLNGNDVNIRRTFTALTQLNDAEGEVNWWEVSAKTTPILGMDAFEKLKLKLIQDVETDTDQINQIQEEMKADDEINQAEKESIKKYSELLYSKYKEMFTRVGEIRNSE